MCFSPPIIISLPAKLEFTNDQITWSPAIILLSPIAAGLVALTISAQVALPPAPVATIAVPSTNVADEPTNVPPTTATSVKLSAPPTSLYHNGE